MIPLSDFDVTLTYNVDKEVDSDLLMEIALVYDHDDWQQDKRYINLGRTNFRELEAHIELLESQDDTDGTAAAHRLLQIMTSASGYGASVLILEN